LRSELNFSLENILTIDAQVIFHKMEERTLGAAYKFYCGKTLENAHSSKEDALATYEVLESQIKKYDELEDNVKFLSDFSSRGRNVDFAGFIIYNEHDMPCFSFGKHKGKTVDFVLENEPGYFGWILNADFPMYTKKVLTQIRLSKLNNKL
jgi:DNA polymerase III subunit epsilon